MAQFESGRLWKKYLLKIKLDNLTIFIENPTTKDQSLTASWQFTSACASSKSCKDLSELIFSIDKRINHPFRCIKRSIVSLIKHRQPCLISLLDHLMNHVTFLARLYTVYVRINLGSSVVLLVNTSGTSPFSIALVRSALRGIFISFLSTLTRSNSWHRSTLFRLISPALVRSLSRLSRLPSSSPESVPMNGRLLARTVTS